MASLNVSTRLNHNVAPTGVETEVVLMASLEAKEQEKEAARNPIDVVIVLDKSGSMAGEKLSLCQKTLEFLIEEAMQETDSMALVTFDSGVYTDFAGGKMTRENKEILLKEVENLRAGSNTNLSGGLFAGIELLKKFGTSDVAAVCLLTDGQLNEGVTNHQELLNKTTALISSFPKGRTQPSVFCFGYGTDADSKIMNLLSEGTGGNYYRITNPESVPISFADCLGGLMAVAAQNVELVCEVSGGGADFAVDPLTKFPFEKLSSCAYKIKIKDMYCGERRDVLCKIRIPALDTTSPTLVNVTCKFVDIICEKPAVISTTTQINRYKGNNKPEGSPDVEVTRHLMRMEAAKAMEDARIAGERGDYKSGGAILSDMFSKTKAQMDVMNLHYEEDQMLSEVMDDLEEASTNIRSSVAFKTVGMAQMQSAVQSHAYQRSNKVDSMMSLGAEETSAYATKSKKSMMQSAKEAFGYQ